MYVVALNRNSNISVDLNNVTQNVKNLCLFQVLNKIRHLHYNQVLIIYSRYSLITSLKHRLRKKNDGSKEELVKGIRGKLEGFC